MNPVASYFKFNPTGAFSVDWYIGKRCNFDCSYCVDYLHDNHSPHVPLENMKKLVDTIYDQHGKNVFWSLTGGEPTVNPKFMELCKYIKQEKGARFVSLTTNGSRTADYFKELFQYIDGVTLSFHFEHMADRVDEYIEKCIQIENWRREWNSIMDERSDFPNWDNGFVRKNLILRFMVYPGQFENVERMEKAFRDHGITNIEHRYIRPPGGNSNELMPDVKLDFEKNHDNMDPKKLVSSEDKASIKAIETREKKFYKEGEKEKIKDLYKEKITDDKRKLKFWFEDNPGTLHSQDYHYNELNFDKKNNYEGWLCWAGVKHLKITPTGDIYIGSCHVGGKRGNIYNKESIDLPVDPIRCPKWRCTDNLDLKVPKIKDWEYYHLVKDMIEWKDASKK